MEPVLLPGDLTSPTWLRLKKHFESRLEYWRMKNDGRHDAIETARIRGRIAQITAFMALGDSQAPTEPDDV